VKVPASEDLANHTVPESCGAYREVCVEALTGVSIGQPLSTETSHLDADCFNVQEGNTTRGAIASPWPVRRCPRPWHVDTLLVREPGDLLSDHPRNQRNGPRGEGDEPKPTMYGQEKSDSLVVAMKSANKPANGGAESMEPRRGAKGNRSQRRRQKIWTQSQNLSVPEAGNCAIFTRVPTMAWRTWKVNIATTCGRSPVRELRSLGSVRGAPRKGCPYRDGTSRSRYTD
jgi:hypothetical protein